MRRVGELMKDLGFNADSPVETQKAFIRHLIRVAGGTPPHRQAEAPPQAITEAQLSFDPHILGSAPRPKRNGTTGPA